MTRFVNLQTLFEKLADQPPEQRLAALAVIGAEDPALRDELATLLNAADRAPGFLSTPASFAADAYPPAPDTASRIGHLVGAYRLVKELGRGGMGEVYLAEREDDQFQHQVAIKLIRCRQESLVRRFQAERQILARLSHPGIARLFDGGRLADGSPYLVMEYVPGMPIDVYCQTHRLPFAARLKLLIKVCRAVQHAHEQGIVHRDLKPQNILVTPDGAPKLLDFGVAKLLGNPQDAGAPLTLAGLAPLTPAFAAPEQLRGQAVSAATDVYALGLMIAKLTEEPVAQGGDEVLGVSLTMNGPSRHFKLSNPLASIVQRALAESPAERYASAKVLADQLEAVLPRLAGHSAPIAASAKLSRYGWRSGALLLAGLLGGLTASSLVTRTANDAPLSAALMNRVPADTNRMADTPASACKQPLATYQKTAADADLAQLVSCRLDLVSRYNDNGDYPQALKGLDALRPLYRNHPRRIPAVKRVNRERIRQEFDRALTGVRLTNVSSGD